MHSYCKSCFRTKQQKYSASNREAVRAGNRAAHAKYRAERLVYKKRRYEALKEAMLGDPTLRDRVQIVRRKKSASWRAANINKSRELYRKANHTERGRLRQKAWRARDYALDPEKYRAREQNYRARRLAAPGSFTSWDIHLIMKKQRGGCFYCGERLGREAWHIDHFIPLARGGTNYPENLVAACATCNLSKNAKMPWEFMPDRFPVP